MLLPGVPESLSSAENESWAGGSGPRGVNAGDIALGCGDVGLDAIGEKEPRRSGEGGALLDGSENRRLSCVLVALRARSASVGMYCCSNLLPWYQPRPGS